MKKIFIILTLLVFTISAYAENSNNPLLKLKGKDTFEYIKLYRENIEVHNSAKKQNPQKIPKRCQKHYSNMQNALNKKLGISGLTINDLESEKANMYIKQQADEYVKKNLQKLMVDKS